MSISDKKKFLIKNIGLLPDEVEQLFPDDKSVEDAYSDFSKLSKSSTNRLKSDGEEEHVDSYDLSDNIKLSRKARAESIRSRRASTKQVAKLKFESIDQSQFPEPEKISFGDFLKHLKKGEDLS